ncbi:MAG: 6-bladed beta-propeller [Acidobacteria bacterium]|nr:6-bladed beta-propeller [Acidobacteriota bacterium]MBU4306872.1 6-bladed beta-propeller [Acidobacteriota bacterium]MCG2811905.1 6-bladed beta-propeller [Candidatus Aminicenantes bacterium]
MNNRRIRFGIHWLLFISCMAFTAMPASAEMVAKLPQVMQPNYIAFTDQRVYVVEESAKIHIFGKSPQGVIFEKTFGQEGEGPGEFDFIHQIRVCKDHLEIPTFGKFARFSLDGQFLDEIKLPMRVFKNAIYRIGENFLVKDWRFDNKETKTTINLYDKDFKLIRELGVHKEAGGASKINLVAEYYSPRALGETIYLVESGKKTIVTIYDKFGVQQREIHLLLPPVKMTDALKETIIKPLKEAPDMKSRWAAFAERLSFPGHAPGLDYFVVVDDRFVTRTYNYRGDRVEFVIFDMQGKELKRVFLPYTGRLNNGCLFCFFQGRFYYLKENLDEEVWELHSEKVW